jgi:hypothetical protein
LNIFSYINNFKTKDLEEQFDTAQIYRSLGFERMVRLRSDFFKKKYVKVRSGLLFNPPNRLPLGPSPFISYQPNVPFPMRDGFILAGN